MTTAAQVTVEDLELQASELDPERAAEILNEHGALVVRGLTLPYLPEIARDIEAAARQSIKLLPEAKKGPNGWTTPDSTLFLPAPPGFEREQQIMVLGVSYRTSAAFFRAAFDSKTVDIVEATLGPNIELFMEGQCLYKEPVGGHAKNLHQDSAYFEHGMEGPLATLNYVVDTDLVNGALYVVPGSHKMGTLRHIDTFSHMGLDPEEWPWERALPITGKAGDSIFFKYRTIHGSQENHSNAARPVFINRYRRVDDFLTGAVNPARRGASEQQVTSAPVPKNQQKGLMVRGFRPYEAE